MNRALLSGERQVAPTLEGIRRDHVARYEWAARRLPPQSHVTDIACGVGYGSSLLARAGHYVLGIDISSEAIEHARTYFQHPRAVYHIGDLTTAVKFAHPMDAMTCFETIEHVEDPAPFLRELDIGRLLVSVPNQSVYPFTGQRFHFRHYTRAEFAALLAATGWIVNGWFGQRDIVSDVEADLDGWTLIADCTRGGA